MNTIPWYQSAILRQQIVQFLIAAFTLFGVSSDTIDWDSTVGSIFAGIAALVALWTFITRLRKPTPPITQEAQERTAEFVKRQGGSVKLLMLALLLSVSATAMLVAPGCAGTRSAYAEARSLDQYAFVLTEHYAALLKQAADLRQKPSTPANAILALQKADSFAGPAVKKLRPLADAYLAAKNAKTEGDLQLAINEVVLALADFVRTIRMATGQPQAVVPSAVQPCASDTNVVPCAVQEIST